MSPAPDTLAAISPEHTLREIARAIPEDCRKNIVIIGSLAAGYHYLRGNQTMVVRTKDADCLLSPHVEAIQAGMVVTENLLDSDWTLRDNQRWPSPGDAATALEDLPAVRLRPPGGSQWFLELLTVPPTPSQREPQWTRLETKHGHFGLRSFAFLSLADFEPIETDFGISVARPEMMALANLLEHPTIRPETMSSLIGGREIKRSNKDLGRVLAIAHLASLADEDVLLTWPELWKTALSSRFPEDWASLAERVGDGLRALLASEPDLDEAHLTLVMGLLASRPPTIEALETAGQRLLVDAVEPLEAGT